MPDIPHIVSIDSTRPNPEIMQKAGKILARKGLVIFPAACMYGVAANALDSSAVEKVFALKQRAKNKAVLLLIPGIDSLPDLTTSVPEQAEKLMSAFWPGKLTLIFHANAGLPKILTARTGKIGIRLPGHPGAAALAQAAGFPITGTSANLSGQCNAVTTEQLHPSIIHKADLILDAGPLKGGTGSSIVDITTDPATIIREGRVSAAQIRRVLSN